MLRVNQSLTKIILGRTGEKNGYSNDESEGQKWAQAQNVGAAFSLQAGMAWHGHKTHGKMPLKPEGLKPYILFDSTKGLIYIYIQTEYIYIQIEFSDK